MKKVNWIIGILLAFFSLWIIYESRKLVYTVRYSPGAGFLPFWLGVVLFIQSVFIFLGDIFATQNYQSNALPGKLSLGRVISVIGILFVCILLLKHLGFILSISISMSLLLAFCEKYRYIKAVSISIITTMILYGIFKIWLGVALPTGILRI